MQGHVKVDTHFLIILIFLSILDDTRAKNYNLLDRYRNFEIISMSLS